MPEAPAEASQTQDGDTVDPRYIKLDSGYTQYATWSNDPRDLDLYRAFRAEGPNLSTDFNVDGLKPILRKKDRELYLMKDAKDMYYLWNLWDGHLLKVSSEFATEDNLDEDDGDTTDGLKGVEKIVSNIIDNLC